MTREIKPHHHGNLSETLISAGIALMEEDGIAALTLRKCAARAGVSHAAPAHHFNGLASLKMAIVARGHTIFAKAMQDEMARAKVEPMSQLQAVAKGYLNFSRAHNALFQLMFQAHKIDFSAITHSVLVDLKHNSAVSYGLLQKASAPFQNIDGTDNSTEITVWSLVHGYAMLFGDDSSRSAPTGSVPDFSVILGGLDLRLQDQSADRDHLATEHSFS